MKIYSFICLFFLIGCQSPTHIPPEPKYVLSHHIESIELAYTNNNDLPNNLGELEEKTRNRNVRGRTSRHIYFPAYEPQTLTHKRIQLLRNYLSDRGYKTFQFKSDPTLMAGSFSIPVRIYVYNVFLPRYNNGDWTPKTAMLTNELLMLEDVAVLFDQSPLPNIIARTSAQAVENYNKKDGGDSAAGGRSIGGAVSSLAAGGIGAITGLAGGASR